MVVEKKTEKIKKRLKRRRRNEQEATKSRITKKGKI